MAEKNTADIGFEKQIWNAACVLRGNMDASEYKGVVLGLIFLKYISDRFEDKYNQLVADGDGFEEDRDEYTSEGIFFVPAGARWSDVSAKAHDPEIGQVIDDAMRAIEKENARLKDILPKNFARPELDKRRLGEVVDLFTNIKMIEHGSEKDILGRTYEYCLSMFAEQEGKRGGEKKSSDWLLRLAGLPWHIVKGFGVAIVRTLIMLAVAALGLSLTTVVLQLPYAVMDTWIFGLTIPMPTLLGGPLSESGLAQAAFCAIGWLVAVAAPGAIVLRLGGGALRKQPYLRHLSELPTQSQGNTEFPANR